MQHLQAAHKICQAAIVLNRDILHWANFIEIMPVPQYFFGEDLILWVPEQLRNSLDKAWHDNRRRVKRGCNSLIPAQGIFDQLRRMLQKPADVSTASEKLLA